MSVRRAFPSFDPSRVVFHDDDLLVVDKAPGIACQSADESAPDDLRTRLTRWLEETGASSTYLGVHHRIDRDTSGLVLFTRRPSANAAIARQFETRTLEKRYLAGVEGFSLPDGATLEDDLAKGVDGVMRVVSRGRGARAISTVRQAERSGRRALLSVQLTTGRTHQARVQLAHRGSPIAGDTSYGGATAARLMLHAVELRLRHPADGRALVLQAPVPPAFGRWLRGGARADFAYDDDADLAERLEAAAHRRWGLAWSGFHDPDAATSTFRLVHEAGDRLPRLAVDVYGEHAVVQLYDDDAPWRDASARARVLDAVAAMGFAGVYLKVRPKQANTLVTTRTDALAPAAPVRGEPAPSPLVVREGGVEYLVRLGDGLSTGLFLDQRRSRLSLRDSSRGKRVLNLFAYHCGFTVAAAVGGAAESVSVDASPVALERGREGLRLVAPAAPPERHRLVADDVFSWLAAAARRGEKFDHVVLDPPSYSTTRASRFRADRDYVELARLALSVVAPSGTLLACTNHRQIPLTRFRAMLREAVAKAGLRASALRDVALGRDFPEAPGAEPHLKSVLVVLSGEGELSPPPPGAARPRAPRHRRR